MNRKIISLSLAAAALLSLSACGPEAAPASTGPADVEAHWEVLETSAPYIANRRYEGYTDALIPADDYGELVPYIGGEVMPAGPFTTYLYGLATSEGEIVTDPAYISVTELSWFDELERKSYTSGLLLLSSADREDEDYSVRYGVCAADGSWYTGQIYSRFICASAHGALFFDVDGDAVMLGYDGEVLRAWPGEEPPISWTEPVVYYWETALTVGDFMRVQLQFESGEMGEVYIDLRDGSAYPAKPPELAAAGSRYVDYRACSGGYITERDGMVEIITDTGGEHSFPLPEGMDKYAHAELNGDRVIIASEEGGVLTDLDGNELVRWPDGYQSFITGSVNSGMLVSSVHYNEAGGLVDFEVTTVCTREGEELLTVTGSARQFGDRLIIVDDDCYRLTDLEGNDLIRLSRWITTDIQAEE